MKYRCIRKCFYAKRLYVVGELRVAEPGEKVPHHFVPLKQFKNNSVAPEQRDKKAVEALGHKFEAKKPEAKKPEAKKPEAKKPEVKKPEAKKPEAKKPEVKKPEAKEADFLK